jgi:hypothetical protein
MVGGRNYGEVNEGTEWSGRQIGMVWPLARMLGPKLWNVNRSHYKCGSQDLTLQAILSNGGRYCQADP